MTAFSPSDAALEGFRLTREHPVVILAWGLFYFVGVLVLGVVMTLALGSDFLAFVKGGGLESGDPAAFAPILERAWPAFLVVVVLAIGLLSVLTGGVYRLALRPDEPSAFKMHLRLGVDELRLTLVNIVMFAIGMVFLFAIAFTGGLISRGGGGLLALVGVAVALLMIWIGVRLSLATPMTFGEGRVAITASWRMTRGHFWNLLGMILLAALFYLMIWVLVSVIGAAVVAVAGGPTAITNFGSMGGGAFIAFLAYMFIQLILPILQVMVLYAPLAIAYRAIRAAEARGATATV